MKRILAALAFLAIAAAPVAALAQDGTLDAADTGDSAWLLVSSLLVLLMTMPGLCLFYGGLVRAKHAVAVFAQIGAVAATASLLWIVAGYTIAFGAVTNGWIGSGNAWMLIDLGNVRAGYAIPESAFVLFQMAFAVITPALMIGAWIDRTRFGWAVTFCALWGLVVYAPVAHWIWGGGWLATQMGVLDFAGGIVVHSAAGVSALVAALLVGQRLGFARTPMLPHSRALALAGAALLWVGWLSLSGGSALAANDDAASAIIATHAAACTAALLWSLIERMVLGKPTGIGFATGALAGLATIAPAAGFVSPGAAIVLGAAGTLVCYPTIRMVRHQLRIDDSLDVFAVHGIGGITGSLLLAVFLSPALGGVGYPEGYTMISQLAAQVVGVGVVAVWSAIGSALIALAVNLFWPMRVSEDAELKGLGLASHGEHAWNLGRD